MVRKLETVNILYIVFIVVSFITVGYLSLDKAACGAFDYIPTEAAIEDGGDSYHNGKATVINGHITDYGRQIVYECGLTDADIAAWEAEGAANGVTSKTIQKVEETPITETTAIEKTKNTDDNPKTVEKEKTPTYTDSEIDAAWVESNRIESTCTEAGYIEYTNSLTNDMKKEELPLSEHNFIEKMRRDATCTEDGKITYECSVCGDTKEEIISATGHTVETTTTDAGLFTEGYVIEKCSVCGEVISETVIPQICPVSLTVVSSVVAIIILACVIFMFKKKMK